MSASSAAFFCENFAGTVSVAGASGTANAPPLQGVGNGATTRLSAQPRRLVRRLNRQTRALVSWMDAALVGDLDNDNARRRIDQRRRPPLPRLKNAG